MHILELKAGGSYTEINNFLIVHNRSLLGENYLHLGNALITLSEIGDWVWVWIMSRYQDHSGGLGMGMLCLRAGEM